MDDTLYSLKDVIFKNRPEAEDLLQSVVDINSHAYNIEGVNRVGGIFRERFESLGFKCRVEKREKVGDILLFENDAFARAQKGGFLFLSHMDTAFPLEEPQVLFRKNAEVYQGHGSTDDKGGAVIAYQALYGLKKLGLLSDIPVRVLLNTDEEEGSMESRGIIEKTSANAGLVFVVEYGKPRPSGATVVTRRFGRGFFELEIAGPGAEGVILDIVEKAYYLAQDKENRAMYVRKFMRHKDLCQAKISYGFRTNIEGDIMEKSLKEIIAVGTSNSALKVNITSGRNRPALIPTEKRREIFDKMVNTANKIDFKIYDEERTAGSDGTFVPDDVPVIDGVGPIGDKVHTNDEFMTLDSLTVRPVLLADMMAEIKV